MAAMPDSVLAITVRDQRSSSFGVDYEVSIKTTLPCFSWGESKVRRTQKEFSWLFRELEVKHKAPFGESEDPSPEMKRLERILTELASNAMYQYEVALEHFFKCPVTISSSISSSQLRIEQKLLNTCTEESLENYNLEQVKDLALRYGYTTLEECDDRDFYVERILIRTRKQLVVDLDNLEMAVQSLDSNWGDHSSVPAADNSKDLGYLPAVNVLGMATRTSPLLASPIPPVGGQAADINLDDALAALEN